MTWEEISKELFEEKTGKRFRIGMDEKNGVGLFEGELRLMYFQFSNIEDATSCKDALIHQCNLMNELSDENEQCKMMIATLRNIILENGIEIND